MFRDAMPGINKIFENDPPEGSIILVTGGAGTLKSSFIFTAMNSHLARNPDRTGIYVTLEETKESHIRNMHSIGITNSERLKIYDVASFKADLGYDDLSSYMHPKDYIDLVLRGLSKVLKKGNAAQDGANANEKLPCCYAIDSLNALQDLAKIDTIALRQRIHELFYTLRSTNVTNFVVLETTLDSATPEFYLADGVIELGIQKGPAGVKRFLQVKKMKSVRHSLEPYVIDIARSGGLNIINPLTGDR
jgi:KaiC/GvpD/RAD55 family RecA-like ATPase